MYKLFIITLLLSIFNACGDWGRTTTYGGLLAIDLRCDVRTTDKNSGKGKFDINFLSNPELLDKQHPLPSEVYDNSWRYFFAMFSDKKRYEFIGNNKDICSFVNNTDSDLYIFYTLSGSPSSNDPDINSLDTLDQAGFSYSYSQKLLKIYKEEDDYNISMSEDAIIDITEDGIEMKYIDRFSFYDQLIEKGYPYIKKLSRGEEYILSWH